MRARETHKREFEQRIESQMDTVRERMRLEMEELRQNADSVREREQRQLVAAQEAALSERDRALASERETMKRHDDVLAELRKLQLSSDSALSDVEQQLKIKLFELQRLQTVHDDTQTALRSAQAEADKARQKMEVLTREFYQMQTEMGARVRELEVALTEREERLCIYDQVRP